MKKMIFSYAGNPGVGLLRRFRDSVEKGWPNKIEIEELTESFINKYQNKIATLSSENLNESIRDYETINQKLGKLYSYVSLTFSINTDKPDFGKKYQEIRELGSIIFSKLVFFELEFYFQNTQLLHHILT